MQCHSVTLQVWRLNDDGNEDTSSVPLFLVNGVGRLLGIYKDVQYQWANQQNEITCTQYGTSIPGPLFTKR